MLINCGRWTVHSRRENKKHQTAIFLLAEIYVTTWSHPSNTTCILLHPHHLQLDAIKLKNIEKNLNFP